VSQSQVWESMPQAAVTLQPLLNTVYRIEMPIPFITLQYYRVREVISATVVAVVKLLMRLRIKFNAAVG